MLYHSMSFNVRCYCSKTCYHVIWLDCTPSPPTKSFDFRGFDSSKLLSLRGWELSYPYNCIGSLPESLTQGLLAGKLLVGGLGVNWIKLLSVLKGVSRSLIRWNTIIEIGRSLVRWNTIIEIATPSPPTKSFPTKSPWVKLSGRPPIRLYGHENPHPLELRVCLSQALRNPNS